MTYRSESSKARFGERLKDHRQLHRHLWRHAPGHWEVLVLHYLYNICRLSLLRLVGSILRRKIVAISLLGRMGDIVACEPVARLVRRQFPDAIILWCVSAQYRCLVQGNPHVNFALSVYCLTEWAWLQRRHFFDHIVDLHVNHKECGYCVRPQKKQWGREAINTDNYYHYGPLLIAFSQSAGYPLRAHQPTLYITPAARRAADRRALPRRYLTIHTLSDEDSRNWDVDKWHELIERIHVKLRLPVVEIGHHSPLRLPNSERYLNLCGRCKILETAEVIRRSVLFIGVDSGPAHLANAGNTPGVVLLGHYRDFRSYMPFTGFFADENKACIIRHPGPAREISVTECFEAVQSLLGKRPLISV